MGNSLRDQLLKSGLVNKKQAKNAHKDKRRTDKTQRKSATTESVSEADLQARELRQEKAQRDLKLNQQRDHVRAKKAIAAEIKQLIEENRVPRGDPDTAYNFSVGTKIKRLFVCKDIRERLSRGALALVKLAGHYELVPSDVAEKIRSRDQRRVIHHNDNPPTKSEVDDAYAEYQVPDDLSW